MKTETDAKAVTIYVNSTDQWHGHPLYSAIVQKCAEQGIAGATVVRCVEGYGSHHQLHTVRLFDLAANLPVRIEIIDIPERVEALLTTLEGMIGEGLVTVQDVHVLQFVVERK